MPRIRPQKQRQPTVLTEEDRRRQAAALKRSDAEVARRIRRERNARALYWLLITILMVGAYAKITGRI